MRKRTAPLHGSEVIWAFGLVERYGVSGPTLWRWERAGLLPERDVHIGGRSGWRIKTIEQAERSGNHPAQQRAIAKRRARALAANAALREATAAR